MGSEGNEGSLSSFVGVLLELVTVQELPVAVEDTLVLVDVVAGLSFTRFLYS